jgi:hypothetical protein
VSPQSRLRCVVGPCSSPRRTHVVSASVAASSSALSASEPAVETRCVEMQLRLGLLRLLGLPAQRSPSNGLLRPSVRCAGSRGPAWSRRSSWMLLHPQPPSGEQQQGRRQSSGRPAPSRAVTAAAADPYATTTELCLQSFLDASLACIAPYATQGSGFQKSPTSSYAAASSRHHNAAVCLPACWPCLCCPGGRWTARPT